MLIKAQCIDCYILQREREKTEMSVRILILIGEFSDSYIGCSNQIDSSFVGIVAGGEKKVSLKRKERGK